MNGDIERESKMNIFKEFKKQHKNHNFIFTNELKDYPTMEDYFRVLKKVKTLKFLGFGAEYYDINVKELIKLIYNIKYRISDNRAGLEFGNRCYRVLTIEEIMPPFYNEWRAACKPEITRCTIIIINRYAGNPVQTGIAQQNAKKTLTN